MRETIKKKEKLEFSTRPNQKGVTGKRKKSRESFPSGGPKGYRPLVTVEKRDPLKLSQGAIAEKVLPLLSTGRGGKVPLRLGKGQRFSSEGREDEEACLYAIRDGELKKGNHF